MNLVELLTELSTVTELSMQKLDEMAEVELTGTGELFLKDGGLPWPVTWEARKQLLKLIGVSNGLLVKLDKNTASQVLTELYRRQGGLTGLVSKEELVGFAEQGRYRPVVVEKMLDAVNQSLGEVEYHRALVLPNYDVRLEILGQDEHAVLEGDQVRAGIALQFNPVGLTHPAIQTFALRQVCVNGMTATTVLEQYTLDTGYGEDPQVYGWARDTAKLAYDGLPEVVSQWQTLAGDSITQEDRALLLTALATRAKLRGKDAAALWARATEEPPQTAYDVLNLMTWVTSHVMSDPSRIIRAQQVSANFVAEELHQKQCPTCQRVAQ